MDARPGRGLAIFVIRVLSWVYVTFLAKVLHHFIETVHYGFNARVMMMGVFRAISNAPTMDEAMRAGIFLYVCLVGV